MPPAGSCSPGRARSSGSTPAGRGGLRIRMIEFPRDFLWGTATFRLSGRRLAARGWRRPRSGSASPTHRTSFATAPRGMWPVPLPPQPRRCSLDPSSGRRLSLSTSWSRVLLEVVERSTPPGSTSMTVRRCAPCQRHRADVTLYHWDLPPASTTWRLAQSRDRQVVLPTTPR